MCNGFWWYNYFFSTFKTFFPWYFFINLSICPSSNATSVLRCFISRAIHELNKVALSADKRIFMDTIID